MEDLIHIKVKENDQGQEKWFEYGLSYEDFAMIQPMLEQCKERRECPMFDPNDPEQSAEMINRIFMPFGMAQQNGRKGIIYNLNDKPEEMTREQVEDIYHRKNILYIRSKKIPTQPIL